MDRAKRNQLKDYVYQTWHASFGRCLAPGHPCQNEPIRAHSVQKEGALRRLAVDGHVVMLRQKIGVDRPPTYDFERVGVNKATSFTGLCSKHDGELFIPIDRRPLDISNREQLFLYAYRAVLREVHVSIEFAAKLNAVYHERARLLLPDTDASERGAIVTADRMARAYEVWQYKEAFEKPLTTGDFDSVPHDCLDLGTTASIVAVSSLFSLDDVPVEDDVARVALTVLQEERQHTYALLTYLDRDATPAREGLAKLLRAGIKERRYLLSRLILERCDNVAISPAAFDSWSQQKRTVIRQFWASTILSNDETFCDRQIDMFS